MCWKMLLVEKVMYGKCYEWEMYCCNIEIQTRLKSDLWVCLEHVTAWTKNGSVVMQRKMLWREEKLWLEKKSWQNFISFYTTKLTPT